jgi:Family of unknown function (DUF5752)
MRTAEHPFHFVTASYLTRIGNHKANALAELAEGLALCSDASIFYHTFQSLGRHHFLTEGFSNDFAQWVLAACNRAELAEQLASLDIRDYLSLAELRSDLQRMVTEFCASNPSQAQQQAFEAFYFCVAIEVAVPWGVEARTLEEFRAGLERLSHASFHYHFIASRLRLHLRTNDFSNWLEGSLDLGALAQRVNRVDIYTNTLSSARAKLVALVDEELTQ